MLLGIWHAWEANDTCSKTPLYPVACGRCLLQLNRLCLSLDFEGIYCPMCIQFSWVRKMGLRTALLSGIVFYVLGLLAKINALSDSINVVPDMLLF